MNRTWALSPWLQVPVGLLLLAVGLGAPFLFVEDSRQADVVASGRVCPTGTAVGAEDCLVPVEGRITEQRGRTSRRYHFEPGVAGGAVVPGAEDDWVRFSGDETASGGATAALLAGAPVTALYAGDRVVAFDVDGQRVTEMSGELGSERTPAWGGLWLGSLGAMMILGAWHRRASPDTAPDHPAQGRAGVAGTLLLTVMLGSFCAFFAGSLRAELVTFAVVAGVTGSLVVLGRVRQHRLRSRGA